MDHGMDVELGVAEDQQDPPSTNEKIEVTQAERMLGEQHKSGKSAEKPVDNSKGDKRNRKELRNGVSLLEKEPEAGM